jgi:hypothetical protein
LEADVRAAILQIFNGGFGDTRPGPPVIRKVGGLVPGVGERYAPADWLTQADIDYTSGSTVTPVFRGEVNWYRNMDRDWEMNWFLSDARINQLSLFSLQVGTTQVPPQHLDQVAAPAAEHKQMTAKRVLRHPLLDRRGKTVKAFAISVRPTASHTPCLPAGPSSSQ